MVTAMSEPDPKTIYLADYAPPDYSIDTIDLDISLAPRGARVMERLDIRPNPDLDIHGPLRLDGEKLDLVRIVLDGEVLARSEYAVDATSLTIGAPPTDPFTLEIEVRIDPAANTALSGLYLSGGVYCTQCEAEGFRRIAYGLDRPDVLSVYTTRIEAPKADTPVLLSNGNLIEAGDCAAPDRHFAVWHDPHPKPTYLFALVGGDLACRADTFRTMSGREVDLRIYVEPGKQDRTGFAMEALKRAMAWDETAYGRGYDLDIFMIVAVSDFNMGAMENKGLNIFNDKFILASPDTATDADYARIEAIIAHEYFHNWTGNRITCRDWFQLCLKEGLTVFRDQEFTRDVRSGAVKRIEDVRTLRSHQFLEDAGPLAHPVRPQSYIEINNFYTATVYEKGAELIGMLKTMLGPEAFRRGMDLYFQRHDGEAALIEDLIGALADGGGRDFSDFLKWYDQAGTPKIEVKARHDAETATLELTIRQSTGPTPGQPDKVALHMPFAIGLLDRSGRELPLVEAGGGKIKNGIVEIRAAETPLRFTGIKSKPVLSMNRNFSAPVILDAGHSEDDLLILLAHDSDGFNRWQAAQSLGLVAVKRRMGGHHPDWLDRFAEALGAAITDAALAPAYRAELLGLPGEADIARDIAEAIDPLAIHNARNDILAAMGQNLAKRLEDLTTRHRVDGPFSPDAAAAGQRRLANAALALRVRAGGDGADIAFAAYRHAGNMTDTIAALTALTHLKTPKRAQALDDFYRRHQSDPLVVDKWLTLQAIAADAGQIAELMKHEVFTLANPNRVRALIGAFAMANPVGFNAADGAGYSLVAETALKLDPLNPQVAARLMAAFRSWKYLEPKRQSLARKALAHVAGQTNLSPDVYEIATKSLA
ncbi:Membrane alanine aminopeptidase N [hydrothermal vent metagenome]|uniref:Membrane alanine aminopeptidase N n=1 Tax=hydrothermal vent metagenome TaxID=652676 RepID=A0A3B0SYC7_9ZZZZ